MKKMKTQIGIKSSGKKIAFEKYTGWIPSYVFGHSS